MILNYRNANDGKTPESLEIQKIEKSYYAFLKELSLNDPQYLYCFSLPEFYQTIFRNNTLSIPRIKETPIDDWLKEAKIIFSDLVGFDKGLFYDLLVSNAYSLQFKNELTPLSDKQKENIRNYFKDGEIATILLRKNEEIIKLAQQKNRACINKTPSVAKEKLMNTIISKYKGKVIVVDFWATWCAPCISAIQEFRKTKNEFNNKGVVFIYITNSSSPQKLWEEKIQGISGEHYYLIDDTWNYVMDNFDFQGIPAYLIYDKNGEIKYKQTSFAGTEKMEEWIKELL